MGVVYFPSHVFVTVWFRQGFLKHEELVMLMKGSIGLFPPPSKSITFLVGDPNLNLHLPQLLGGGTTQGINSK